MVYFLSYGDDKYANSKIRIRQEAEAIGIFDQIDIYEPKDIDPSFLEFTKPYSSYPRGGGLWLWKSFLLKKTFANMKEGDYCVYADAGCMVNPHGSGTFLQYMKLLKHDSGIISFRMDGLDEEQYTTEEIFKFLQIETNSPIRKSGQIMATILIMRKCENSTKLVNDYYNLAITNPKLFSDEFNNSGNCERFIDNRHDQSILSVLRKKHGSVEIIDETWAPDMNAWNNLIFIKKIPFLATRIRG